MATAKQVQKFISDIAPYIVAYAKRYGYKVASPIIAQACIESAYGTSKLASMYHNYFGMKCGTSWKGASVNMATKEEYTVGTLTDIRANFRAYTSMDEGVKGYFDFISSKRYENLKTASSPIEYLEMIKADGYATSSTYVKTNMTVVDKYNLTSWDNFDTEPTEEQDGAKEEPKDKSASVRYCKVVGCWYLSCRNHSGGSLLGIFKRDTVLTLLDSKTEWWKVAGTSAEGKKLTGFCYCKYLKEV